MAETIKRRGRPKTRNAKTAAERQREYRARQQAGLVPSPAKDQRIIELEARVWKLEVDNQMLRARLERQSENTTIRCLAEGCGREAKTKRTVEIETCLCVGLALDLDYGVPVELIQGAKSR